MTGCLNGAGTGMTKRQIEEGKIRVLVTGANGFVGHALCAILVRHGHNVRGAVRRNDVILNPLISRVTVGEINRQTDWTAALEGIDVLIHLAARVHVMHETSKVPLDAFRSANVHGTEHLARSAAAQGVKRMVFVSSIKVNGDETEGGRCYTELDIPSPQAPYGISKWEAEQALHRVAQETGLEVVIVRPPLVYGPGVKGNFERILRALIEGMPLPLASVRNLRSLIYIENLVDAIRICAIHPAATGQTFLLSDGDDISTPNLTRQLALAMCKPARLFPFPTSLLRIAGKLLGKSEQIGRLLGSLQIDSGKIRRELNWQPPCTLQTGLQTTVDWYKNS
jgi:nucleoside-diphosphate-sugar epimerase